MASLSLVFCGSRYSAPAPKCLETRRNKSGVCLRRYIIRQRPPTQPTPSKTQRLTALRSFIRTSVQSLWSHSPAPCNITLWRCTELVAYPQDAHHCREAGDELDRVLDVLLRHLHRRAVLLLQGQRVAASLRHPLIQLNTQWTEQKWQSCELNQGLFQAQSMGFQLNLCCL